MMRWPEPSWRATFSCSRSSTSTETFGGVSPNRNPVSTRLAGLTTERSARIRSGGIRKTGTCGGNAASSAGDGIEFVGAERLTFREQVRPGRGIEIRAAHGRHDGEMAKREQKMAVTLQ